MPKAVPYLVLGYERPCAFDFFRVVSDVLDSGESGASAGRESKGVQRCGLLEHAGEGSLRERTW
jgi:hypothetical protein